jgi:hypothetical protein
VADPTPAALTLALQCANCTRNVLLSYSPGTQATATTYFCPYCHRVNRLEVPGAIRGVTRAQNEKF